AWGYADKLPARKAQIALGRQISALFGVEPQEPREPVPLAGVALRPSRVKAPSAWCTDAHAERVTHTFGRSYPDQLRGFGGDFAPAPDLVARPGGERELSHLFEWAAGAGVAVVPYGGGTSVVGGVTYAGERPWVSLDLGGFDQALEIDPLSRLARLQAGLTGPAVEAALAPHGLTLRHFPQSFEFSTVGGWIATRAGGHFATVYTHIDDLVAGVRMLTPGTGVFETRPLPGSGAGPSPDRLVLGSEGTLGVITDAWLRVRPRPRWRARAAVHFDGFDEAVAATRDLAQSGLYPTNCRLLDKFEAMVNGVTGDGRHVLLVAFESADHPLDDAIARAVEIGRAHGGRCPRGPKLSDAEAEAEAGREADAAGQWKSAFIDAPYLQPTLITLGIIAVTFETACSWGAFPALHAAVKESVRTAAAQGSRGLRGHLGCRFTHVYPDGPAPYYTFIVPSRSGAEMADWARIKHAASDAIVAHGGTITHHHAVGRTHRPWAERQRPAGFTEVLRAARQVLDPAGILNPGALITG
ncbi:MAG: FAD-binding oxidoreductase, partial [Myxococcales bacterium]|nr:FAD-binding oxidoreductase [Myxococcales bacterium]